MFDVHANFDMHIAPYVGIFCDNYLSPSILNDDRAVLCLQDSCNHCYLRVVIIRCLSHLPGNSLRKL